MADTCEVVAAGTGDAVTADPAVHPATLTAEQVADMLEQVAAADVDVAVQRLDELLAQLRPATRVRQALTRVPATTMRAAVELLARRQGRR